MIRKFALSECAPLVMNIDGSSSQMIRTASGNVSKILIEPGTEKARIIEAEIKKHPTALFFRSKSIEANKHNSNGDYFSEEELLNSYKSFEGVPFFTNHENQDIEKAKGKIIFAEWNGEEKAVYTTQFVDREAYPHICRSIEEGYASGVSMGSMWGEAMIAMADGSLKKIKDINKDEYVVSAFGNSCKVEKVYSAKLNKPMYGLKLNGYTSDNLFSDDHPIFVKNLHTEEPEFKEVVNLTKSDFILVPIEHALKVNKNKIAKISDNCVFLIYKDIAYVGFNFIDRIENDFNDKYSYDIKVENDESYIADGIAVHNCSVEYSVCNICQNRAEQTSDYCSHIRNRKGRKFTGSVRNVVTGETKTFKDEPVFEYNYGIKFIELSAVVDPACPSCRIQGVIPCDEYIKKAANVENSLRMIKIAALEKRASQEEIDQIEQAIETLEGIAINLIKNRKQVEVSFASDLVEILANLQEWSDELVGAGYGNLQNVPGTEGNEPEGIEGAEGQPGDPNGAPAGAPAGGAPDMGAPDMGAQATGAPAPTPVAETSPAPNASVGQVAGKANASLVKSPERPSLPITAPPRKAEINNGIRKLSEGDRINKGRKIVESISKVSNLLNNISNGEEDMGKRRTLTEKNAQIEKTMQILSESWQEKQDFCKYIKEVPSINEGHLRLAVKKSDDTFVIVAEDLKDDEVKVWKYEDLTNEIKDVIKSSPKVAASMLLKDFKSKKLEGENIMINQKQAGANTINSNTEVIQEKQLEQARDLYHPRTDDNQEVVTEKQLGEKRTGEDKDVVTQKQLDEKIKLHPRTGTEEEVLTQKQLESVRENDEKDVVTEKQIGEKRTDSVQEVVTEKQLNNVATPWARAAKRDASQFKTASDHMQSVIEVMAETAIETGATPQELQKIASTLVAGTKARYDLMVAITEESKSTSKLPYNERLAFWSNKSIKFASASVADVEQALIGKLRVIASDLTINPEIIVEAVDVVGEDSNAIDSITEKIDAKISAQASVASKKSVKSELRNSLKPVTSTKEERDAKRQEILASLDDTGKQKRESERKSWETKVASALFDPSVAKKSDLVIEASLSEIGCTKESISSDSNGFKKSIVAFAKGALSANNVKLASIVNVTVNKDTVQIAVQTENEDGTKESFEFPLGDEKSPEAGEEVPEGDLTGEGLENNLGTEAPAAAPAPAATSAPVGGAPASAPALASSKKNVKVAQSTAGAGGIPNAPAGGAPDQAGAGVGGVTGETPVQSLTGGAPEAGAEEAGNDEEIPTVGEKQMPWTICPECGSSDVDVDKEEDGGIKGTCNACSAEYEAMIKKIVEFKIIKPTQSIGEEGVETPEAPEAPEMPALPVAASTRLNKKTITRIAKNVKQNGHVCPACGNKHCKASVESQEHTECKCGICHTAFSKDIVAKEGKPEDAHLVVQWDVVPSCKECVEKAAKFASKVKVSQMMKTAGTAQFPMTNCMERIAREYGSDTVGSFGPCKGKLVSECVCKQLKTFALSKVRHLDRLAKVAMQKDPMDECIEDQKKSGYNYREACSICGVIKKKFAKAGSDNIFVQAFAEDVANKKIKELTLEDLMNMGDLTLQEAADADAETVIDEDAELDQDIADAALPEASEAEIEIEEGDEGVEGVEGEDTCKKCNEVVENCKCGKKPKDTSESEDVTGVQEPEVELEGDEAEGEKGESMRDLLASSSQVKRSDTSALRIADKLKKIETIENDVNAGVPRKESYMGKEKDADSLINKNLNKPQVPRKESYMGKEKEADSLINSTLSLPDVATGKGHMGHEQEIQKGMPGTNTEIKGTVIAKKLKEVDSIEGDVDVPRGKATLGEEGKDNIDVALNKPQVPRGEAYMGKEKEADSLINEKLNSPDIPTGDAYMGNEKEIQKDMPANNDEYLKTVKQKKEVQLERIATARREAARDTAAWLAANGRIASDRSTYDNVIKALSSFEIDKIAEAADKMFPEKAKKTVTASTGHSIPAIVLESKVSAQNDLQTQLTKSFTIGNKSFDHALTIYKDEAQD